VQMDRGDVCQTRTRQRGEITTAEKERGGSRNSHKNKPKQTLNRTRPRESNREGDAKQRTTKR
jgi:hypothetical protein